MAAQGVQHFHVLSPRQAKDGVDPGRNQPLREDVGYSCHDKLLLIRVGHDKRMPPV
jgi:hypothetical protein